MDAQIQDLIDLVKEKIGLEQYRLQNHSIYRQSNIFLDTKYILSMEWFPIHIIDWKDDELNPDGTAVIELDINSHQLLRIIFVGGKTMATKLQFDSGNIDGLITWIEQETGLRYMEQFQLKNKEDMRLHFQSCYNGVRISPSGFIDIELSEDGNLQLFSINGEFPSNDLIIENSFSLDLNHIHNLSSQQVKLLEFPSDQTEQWVPAYVLEEIYVKNDGSGTIPYVTFLHEKPYIEVKQILKWEEPIKVPFKQKRISFSEEISIKEVFAAEPHPDTYPITSEDQENCLRAVLSLLRSQFPNDSGKWMLVSLFREKGYLRAILKLTKTSQKIFSSKINVFIDPENFKVVQFIDNTPFLEMFNHYKPVERVTVTHETAVDSLLPYLELTPIYIYDFEKQRFVLCGKLDCQKAVLATNGYIVNLDEL